MGEVLAAEGFAPLPRRPNIPDLVRLDCDMWAQAAKLPSSTMVPSPHALRLAGPEAVTMSAA